MKKIFFLLLFLGAVSFNAFLPYGSSASGDAPPPTVIITRPPAAVVIPGTRYVYFLPDYDSDILFYHGNWYRPYSDNWFKSKGYNGPWERVLEVPALILKVPAGFRSIEPGRERIPYRSLKKHWREWESGGYWDELARKGRLKEKKAGNKAVKKAPKPPDEVLKKAPVGAEPQAPEETLKETPEETLKGVPEDRAKETAGEAPADALTEEAPKESAR